MIRNTFVDSFQIGGAHNRCLRCVKYTRHIARYVKSGKKFIHNEPPSDTGASVGDVLLKKRKKIKKRVSSSKPAPVSDEELAQHVSSMYSHGSSGVVSQLAKKRERIEKNSKVPQSEDDENKEYLKNLDRHLTLVLNADYQPLSVLPLSMWTWQETIKSLFSGKVTVVEVYSDISIRAVNMDVPLPSVIALNEFCPQPHQTPAFTRRNVFLRDGYRCQYCYKRYRFQDLSLDHLHPRCMGGQLKWDNTVTSCRKCNGKKGSTLPKDLRLIGMKLVREPFVPTKYELALEAQNMLPRAVHPTWRPYLGMGFTAERSDPAKGEDYFSFLDDYP